MGPECLQSNTGGIRTQDRACWLLVVECWWVVEVDNVGCLYMLFLLYEEPMASQLKYLLLFYRYSDFHALHEKICSKYDRLSKLAFPSKKTFGNMERQVLESRRKMLDCYLKALLDPATLESNLGLIILLHRFLDQVC